MYAWLYTCSFLVARSNIYISALHEFSICRHILQSGYVLAISTCRWRQLIEKVQIAKDAYMPHPPPHQKKFMYGRLPNSCSTTGSRKPTAALAESTEVGRRVSWVTEEIPHVAYATYGELADPCWWNSYMAAKR